MAEETIKIFGREDFDGDDRAGGLFDRASSLRLGTGEVDKDTLRRRLSSFLETLRDVIEGTPVFLGAFEVESVTLTVEVSAGGSVSLLGMGGEVGGSGGLTFTLKREEKKEPGRKDGAA